MAERGERVQDAEVRRWPALPPQVPRDGTQTHLPPRYRRGRTRNLQKELPPSGESYLGAGMAG